MAGLRRGKSATIVILSLAVSTSSKRGLVIAMARSPLGMRSALGVFLCMEYNRNSRFNFVGKGIPLVGGGTVKLTVRIGLLVPSTIASNRSCQSSLDALGERLKLETKYSEGATFLRLV